MSVEALNSLPVGALAHIATARAREASRRSTDPTTMPMTEVEAAFNALMQTATAKHARRAPDVVFDSIHAFLYGLVVGIESTDNVHHKFLIEYAVSAYNNMSSERTYSKKFFEGYLEGYNFKTYLQALAPHLPYLKTLHVDWWIIASDVAREYERGSKVTKKRELKEAYEEFARLMSTLPREEECLTTSHRICVLAAFLRSGITAIKSDPKEIVQFELIQSFMGELALPKAPHAEPEPKPTRRSINPKPKKTPAPTAVPSAPVLSEAELDALVESINGTPGAAKQPRNAKGKKVSRATAPAPKPLETASAPIVPSSPKKFNIPPSPTASLASSASVSMADLDHEDPAAWTIAGEKPAAKAKTPMAQATPTPKHQTKPLSAPSAALAPQTKPSKPPKPGSYATVVATGKKPTKKSPLSVEKTADAYVAPDTTKQAEMAEKLAGLQRDLEHAQRAQSRLLQEKTDQHHKVGTKIRYLKKEAKELETVVEDQDAVLEEQDGIIEHLQAQIYSLQCSLSGFALVPAWGGLPLAYGVPPVMSYAAPHGEHCYAAPKPHPEEFNRETHGYLPALAPVEANAVQKKDLNAPSSETIS